MIAGRKAADCSIKVQVDFRKGTALHGQSETAQESREHYKGKRVWRSRISDLDSIIEQLNELVDVASCLIHRSLYDAFSVVRKPSSFDSTRDHFVR
jgi:hypothetical protein